MPGASSHSLHPQGKAVHPPPFRDISSSLRRGVKFLDKSLAPRRILLMPSVNSASRLFRNSACGPLLVGEQTPLPGFLPALQQHFVIAC